MSSSQTAQTTFVDPEHEQTIIKYLENHKNLKNIVKLKIAQVNVGEWEPTNLMFERTYDRTIKAYLKITITLPDSKHKNVRRTITTSELADPVLAQALTQYNKP